ncbi:hypothetical protein [Hirschia litorea]|uniref:Uncharacterized protein n=1 Tax=Hirschia litorea TaxID=1199156 RepID=A0ABW2IQ19_9PROT
MRKKSCLLSFIAASIAGVFALPALADSAIHSIDTGYTVTNVRTATYQGGEYIIANTFEGTLLAYDFNGKKLWENKLSGFMNHDVWCDDITGDGGDECFAANADGHIYALNSKGKLLWSRKFNDAPMLSVTVIKSGDTPYVVAGGFDTNIYYLNADGERVKTIPSQSYSVEKSWGMNGKKYPQVKSHVANFLRPVQLENNENILVMHGAINQNNATGSLYLFKPLADTPYKIIPSEVSVVGSLTTFDADGDGDGIREIMLGNSGTEKSAQAAIVSIETGDSKLISMNKIAKKNGFGYRVVQPQILDEKDGKTLAFLYGSRFILQPMESKKQKTITLESRYSFNDIWVDETSKKFILASVQSGGSAIHIIDPANPKWRKEYETISPPGKLASILANTAKVRAQLDAYTPPNPANRIVYFVSETRKGVEDIIKNISENYASPVFFANTFSAHAEDWDRSGMQNEKYRKRRDKRKIYDATQAEILARFKSELGDEIGINSWGGHGNDPFMFSLDTAKKLIDLVDGKRLNLIYPELEDPSDNFSFVMDNLIYPLASYGQGKNFTIHLRTKHGFWFSDIYSHYWTRVMSGEFADVFVPSMEETTDKSMDLSLAARIGIWASGAVNDWGNRSARDNPSYFRLRQHSHQMVPNHFLRQQIYAIASGATHQNNFPVDQEYMSLLWELVAKGVLYVPKREELVSLNPVYLGMMPPNKYVQNEAGNVKWITFFDAQAEAENPLVFSHLNGTWPGAPVTQWDFSNYAANVKERRYSFIPPYPNGMVMLAPLQYGNEDLPRGKLVDHLHPMYKNILKEYPTDGQHYYAPDLSEKYAANTYYTQVKSDIESLREHLPLTVTGNVGWVVAQMEEKKLRLTLVDGGYLNPNTQVAHVKFRASMPTKMTDVLSGEVMDISENGEIDIQIPTGSFRFIDIDLEKPLSAK